MTEPTTTTATAGRGSVPEANRPVVEGELRRALRYAAKRRERYGPPAGAENVLLLRAAPEWRAQPEFTVLSDHRPGTGPVTVTVRGCATVLAVLDALSEPRDPESYLVILTPRENRELGNSVLAQVLGNEVRPINRWDLVAEAFGARRLDPRLDGKGYRWLAEALLEAQPGAGWKRINGPVLQLDAALRRLTAVRFAKDPERDGEERLDAAALLEWSRDETRLARFLDLRDEERQGLIGWLEESIGPVAQVVFRLLRSGQAADAIPFGLAAAELYAPAAKRRKVVTEARIRAEERFLGGQAPAESSLWAFAEAAESLVLRCGDTGHAPAAKALRDRAEQILAELGAGDLAGASKVLDAGLDARLAALAAEITAALPVPATAGLGPLEEALDRLWDHRRCGERSGEVEAAVCAVRLVRWLAEREEAPAAVAEGAFRQVRSWGWADRATAVIFNADTVRVPSARAAYRELFGAVRAKRAELDRAFADRLAGWSPVAGPTGDLLLAENLLERVARPVAERGAPLIIVLDGMSTAAACALAEEIAATRTWTEVGRSGTGA